MSKSLGLLSTFARCPTLEEAIEYLKEHPVDTVLLDITLSGSMDGVDVAHFINATCPVPFIFLTSHADSSTVQRVKKTRPGGYLVKPFDENDLYTSIEMAMTNYFILHPPKVELSLSWLNERLVNPLSEREFQMLLAVKSGKTNAEVADEANLSVNTVKTHLQNIYSKMDVRNRTEALFRLNELLMAE